MAACAARLNSADAGDNETGTYGPVVFGRPNSGVKSKTQLQIKSFGLTAALDAAEVTLSINC
ncbi:hypothetical protein [Acinetobacter tjernbergiae]|uniref:hypothetical protein n=1 Tax=Acinetobacter tjernbergiae TaxID=202955 RepID=UPI0003803E26|nr:hypothetical protein [Acinetobacter tjernbergiae]